MLCVFRNTRLLVADKEAALGEGSYSLKVMKGRGKNPDGLDYIVATQRRTRKHIWSGWGVLDNPKTHAEVRKAAARKGILLVSEPQGRPHTAAWWAKRGIFRNADEVKGALRLAYQQGMDGMGPSAREWMGLTKSEFDAWMRDDAAPVALVAESKAAFLDAMGEAWGRVKSKPSPNSGGMVEVCAPKTIREFMDKPKPWVHEVRGRWVTDE